MFEKLFAEGGLTLERLRALLEVGAAGSIVRAAGGDPVRQSQYSRQIKELEDFFRARLIERQGRGSRLTASGKELARISRFFMLGLSNFQRGSLAAEQQFRIGASATFIRHFLLPVLARRSRQRAGARYVTEALSDEEIERRLHDLTLDFGVVAREALSRPLQTQALGAWPLELWVPRALRLGAAKAAQAFAQEQLPLAIARKELEGLAAPTLLDYEACLVCDSFLEAGTALESGEVAALLPAFLAPGRGAERYVRVPLPEHVTHAIRFHIAWNPRLLRLNPPAARRRDWLVEALTAREPASQD